MKLTTHHAENVAVVHVQEAKLVYPLLSVFSETVTALIGGGERQVLLDLSGVTYIDSASIGCLMDLYRQAVAQGGTIRLSGVQPRVATMLTMTGAQHFLEIHPDEASGIRSFGA